MIKVLFDQKTIANYRVGILNRLSCFEDIRLTVSYWGDCFLYEFPNKLDGLNFDTVLFTPIKLRINSRIYWFNFDLVKYIAKERPDVVLCHLGTFGVHPIFSYLIEKICSLFFNVRFVYRFSGYLLPENKNTSILKGIKKIWFRMLFHHKVVLTYTERAAEIVRMRAGHNVKVFVDYNSMDTEELFKICHKLEVMKKDWENDFLNTIGNCKKHYVLFAGRLTEQKRVDLLLDAWGRIHKYYRDWGLLIVGSGSVRESLMKNYTNNSVKFINGIYNHEELAKYYFISDIVIFPGYATLSIHFAMCFGKAIITSQYGNEAEYVTDEISGLKYDYGDVNMLVEKMERLMSHKDLRSKFGKEAEKIVRKKINIENMIRVWKEAICKML